MKIVEIRKTALEVDSEDWSALSRLIIGFRTICDSMECSKCPLENFCDKNDSPAEYIGNLIAYLDD